MKSSDLYINALKRIINQGANIHYLKGDGEKAFISNHANSFYASRNPPIEFIEIETKRGVQRKNLKPGDTPVVTFKLVNDEFVNAYAYCNLHGLWDGK